MMNALDYQTLSTAQIRNLRAGYASGVIAQTPPPIYVSFTAQTQVTIAHTFGTPFLSVTIYILNGQQWNELPRTSYSYETTDTDVVVYFDAVTDGVIKLTI